MPCQVDAELIRILPNDSVIVSGAFTGNQGFFVSVDDLTASKAAILAAPTWSVVFFRGGDYG